MLAGTVATAVLLLVTPTTAPPAGAALVSVTVAVEVAPAATLAGLSEMDTTAATPAPPPRKLTAGREGAVRCSSMRPQDKSRSAPNDSMAGMERERRGMRTA